MRKGIVKYTAFIPKTIKAVKCIGSTFIKKVDCYLNNTSKKLKNVPRRVDQRVAKSITSLTKKKYFTKKRR
jgi:hypothetical protein